MIYINNVNKLKLLNSHNFYVVSDFDLTISAHNSQTTFSLFARSGLYPKEYTTEINKLFQYYRPLELNPNLSYQEKVQLANEWHMASYNLMLKYQIKESDIDKILKKDNSIILRDHSIDFLNYLNNNNIPIIICSAGIGNFIIKILQNNNCYSDNIFLHSNILEFKNNIIKNSHISIHSMVKNQINLPNYFRNKIANKDYAIIIGDQLNDLNMAKYLPKKDIISIGFLESNIEQNKTSFMNQYDIVLTEYESFKPIQKIIDRKQ